MDFPWKFEVHSMGTSFFMDQKVTSPILWNTQYKNIEKQESVSIISGLSTTKKSKTFTKELHNYII